MPPIVDSIRRALRLNHEDSVLGVLLSWLLAPPLMALLGFYTGTVFGTNHVVDLQYPDMQRGFVGAGIGLVIGIVFAILVTVLYPRLVEADAHADHEH